VKKAFVVFRKELSEVLRDRRVRSNAIVVPMLLVIGMLAMLGSLGGIGETRNQKIHVVAAENQLVTDLKEAGFQVITVPTIEEGRTLIQQGRARVVLFFPEDTDQALEEGRSVEVQAHRDPLETSGEIALNLAQRTFAKRNAEALARVLAENDVAPEAVNPVTIKENRVLVGKEGANEFLLSMLPYFIVIWAFYGGLGMAGDLVAGEKEKMTLETLLIAPVERRDLALGKFLALASICFISSVSALLGFVLAGVSGLPQFRVVFPDGLGIGVTDIALILLALLPTIGFFAGLLLAVSTYAKNSREAQSYMALISFVVILPAIFGQFIGFTDIGSNLAVRFVPVLNTSMAVREALQGKPHMLGLTITVLQGLVLAAISVWLVLRMFRREQVLTRI
jgi:sodium transport system permease protein